MDVDKSKNKLLTVLQARGIPLGLDDIQWAFDADVTRKEAAAWIEEYLNEATLLTREEKELYDAIGETTKLELSSSSHEVVPLLDRDIKEAIAALKSSTSAIENHAKALETQKEVLLQLRGAHPAARGPPRGGAAKYAQEKSSLSFAIEDLSFSITEQLKEAETEAAKSLYALKSFSSERLAADEQVLEALSAVSGKALSTTGPQVSHAELEKWLQALAALRASEVKSRINSILAPAGPIANEELGDEDLELQAELETLKDEIDAVVHMVIGHELRNPLMKSVEAFEKGDRAGRQSWSRYLLSMLEYLVAQLDGASTRVSELRSYSDALLEIRSIVAAIEEESKTRDEPAVASTAPNLTVKSPALSSAPQTPTSSIPSALRRLNIQPTEGLSKLDTLALASSAKLQAQYASTEKIFIDTLGKSLDPKQKDALAILKQLYATSHFGSIHLIDEGLEAKISGLGKRIDELAPKIATGDLR
ncbi:uncharacterized protein PV09_03132 [Verruconis gallopava]|uniref:HAUS augmin-like complex subunit 3 N-terminal domain-containing protein n=1 Tax=Verruconis gallopava TaxID=253628 RepID=A0A0D1YZ21_9PEZI|nr:uncharacterized protein PV09_03132 [Verruconis gallopava]KIW05942.1 hypothetical protein PV09_03132 [Verruconis gallopava]